LDDAEALSGLTSVRAIYDIRTKDEKALQFIFTVIRDTYDETVQQDVKARYVASMRGPTIKLLSGVAMVMRNCRRRLLH
jgi:hypothetical protein